MNVQAWVIVTETDGGIVVPKFKVHGPYESWHDASNANGVHNGEITPLPAPDLETEREVAGHVFSPPLLALCTTCGKEFRFHG